MSVILAHINGALNDFLLLFCDALVLMLVWLGKYWTQQIGTRVHNERARGILQRAESLAIAVVKRTYLQYVKPAKDRGGWDAAAQEQAITLAKAELKSHLGSKGMQELAWVLFGDTTPPADIDPDGLLETLLEAAVHDNKQLGRSLKPAAPAPLFPAFSVPRTPSALMGESSASPLDSAALLASQPAPTAQANTSMATPSSPSPAV